MRKFFTLLLFISLSFLSYAQSLHVCQGNLTIGVPATSADTMTYSNGQLQIMGSNYDINRLDSLVYSAESVLPQTVFVNYAGTTATVFAAGDVASYLTVGINGADVTIKAAADLEEEISYVLSGNATDGSFTQTGSYKCTLELAGLNLTNTRGAAIDIQNGKRINVLVAGENVLTDGAGGTHKACFIIKGHAEFSGTGSLSIKGNTKHAYDSGEYTMLTEGFTGTLKITGAISDGIHAEQFYQQQAGTVSISGCGGDGIDLEATTDTADENNGEVLISGGQITIDLGAAEDVKGIKCDNTMTISGGAITISGTGDGVKGMKTGANLLVNQASGNATSITINVTGTTYHKDQDDESKTRGIKVDGDFTFDGGTINVSATGKKAKAIAVDGTYYYKSGTINCAVDATNVG